MGAPLVLAAISAASDNAVAGGGGYSMAFDGLRGMVISMDWAFASLSELTIEYWMLQLYEHVDQSTVFAYSSYSVDGHHSTGGPVYENPNELT